MNLFVRVVVLVCFCLGWVNAFGSDDVMIVTCMDRDPGPPLPDCLSAANLLVDPWGPGVNGVIDSAEFRNNTTSKITRVPLRPNKPWPTPPNWTAAAGGSVNPTPPLTTALGSTFAGGVAEGVGSCVTIGGSSVCDASISVLATAAAVAFCTWSGNSDCVGSITSTTVNGVAPPAIQVDSTWDSAPYVDAFAITYPPCPTGYTLATDHSICNLTDASVVVKPPDGIMNIKRDGTLWSADPNDSDSATVSADQNVVISGSNITIGDPDSGGLITVHVNSDGTISMLSNVVCAGGLCYSLVSSSYPASGVGGVTVSGKDHGTASGTAGLPANGYGAGSGGSGGLGAGVTFPGDFPDAGSNAKLAQIHADLTAVTGVEDLIPATDSELGDAFFKETFTGLLAWTLPAMQTSCPTWTLTLPAGWATPTLVLDKHCQFLDDAGFRALLNTLLPLIYAVAALFVVLSA